MFLLFGRQSAALSVQTLKIGGNCLKFAADCITEAFQPLGNGTNGFRKIHISDIFVEKMTIGTIIGMKELALSDSAVSVCMIDREKKVVAGSKFFLTSFTI